MNKLSDAFNRFGHKHTYVVAVLKYLAEMAQVIVISLAIVLPIRYFLIQPFYVKGASMEPNFHDNEYLIIDELSYRFRPPSRGETVVFRYPLDPKQFFIKRVIGLPGEIVKIANGQIVIFNSERPEGFSLEENYIEQGGTYGEKNVKLGLNEYFVLGDNRRASLDSRIFGGIQKELITGRVWLRGWPLNKLDHFTPPIYEAELTR